MKKAIILTVYFACAVAGFAQSFHQFISGVDTLVPEQRQALTDSFMAANSRFPYLENDTMCLFIYKGEAKDVRIAGDQTGWEPTMVMTRLEGTDFWYKAAVYENDARLDYKIVVNDSEWILDPKNPFTCAGGYGTNSELRMPGYQYPPELSYYSSIRHGSLTDTVCHSDILKNNRNVSIYLPAEYDSGKEYPFILFHDGPDYLKFGEAVNILDYLVAVNSIEPVIGIFVSAVDRRDEYALSKRDDYTAFIIRELLPSLEKKYSISRNPAKRAVIGPSNGGNIALYMGMKHPEQFGKVAAQSSNIEPYISKTFRDSSRLNLTIYLDVGKYDIGELIPLVQNFNQLLQNKNYPYQFREWHEGHSWGNWKGHLRYPLIQFFPQKTGTKAGSLHEKENDIRNNPK